MSSIDLADANIAPRHNARIKSGSHGQCESRCMGQREAHIASLARQSVDILRARRPITGRQRYVFPAISGGGQPLKRKYSQRRDPSPGLLTRGNDFARIPQPGEYVVE
jgi:hypothetical protein